MEPKVKLDLGEPQQHTERMLIVAHTFSMKSRTRKTSLARDYLALENALQEPHNLVSCLTPCTDVRESGV